MKQMSLFLTLLLVACAHTKQSAQSVEIPILQRDCESQIISHTGFTVSYNQTWCIPNWVAYEITEEEANGQVPRSKDFCPDPDVVGYTSTTDDYKRSGYDRGHMAPAGDMKWSEQAMKESFYMSNICPQAKYLNLGLWLDLENLVRVWAKKYGSLYVVCGPIVADYYETIGESSVAVPESFFKVLCRCDNGQYQAIGFLFPNKECYGSLYDYALTIDSIETLTNIDFFPTLEDEIENKMEAEFNVSKWK